MAEQESLITGFKNFILRGNVVDLAVAVVIGTAFGALVTALVQNVITPLIAAIFGQKGAFDNAFILTINGSDLKFGIVLSAILNFLAVAAVIYFLVVVPLNKLMARFASGEETISTPDPQLELLTEIRDLLAASNA